MTQGKFIVIEGLEGAGKSTAVQVVLNALKKRGLTVITTREPGGTPLAEKMRALIKEVHPDEPLTDMAELFLLYAARTQLVENVIKPALARGEWVIGDRHDLSTQAYQGGGRGFSAQVLAALRDMALGDFHPDLILYMDIDAATGLERARTRGALDRIEQQQLDFFERARSRYRELMAKEPCARTIDASLSIDEVAAHLTQELETWLKHNAN
ncbi:MAG: dTMP kinase [Vibrionaceae bacterium]